MVKEFDNVVFTSTPGAVYGPVRTDFGHHLIYLHRAGHLRGVYVRA